MLPDIHSILLCHLCVKLKILYLPPNSVVQDSVYLDFLNFCIKVSYSMFCACVLASVHFKYL